MIRIGKTHILVLLILMLIALFYGGPLRLMIIGKHTTGLVKGFEHAKGKKERYSYPVVEFFIDKNLYSFVANVDEEYRADQEVSVVYNPENVNQAQIFTYLNLFHYRTIFFIFSMLLLVPIFVKLVSDKLIFEVETKWPFKIRLFN